MNNAADRQTALMVVRVLREAGFVAYFAGGCVRDMLMGLESADYDVATDATPEQVTGLFRRVLHVGAAFGVAVVIVKRKKVEVTTFRSDVSYTDGRRPDAVRFSSPQEDAQRRDFTINGMFFDPLAERVIDYVGGQEDLRARVVRTIGQPDDRFGEDFLRMIRAVRFATRFDFALDPATAAAIRRHAARITAISGERILDELTKMLLHPRAAQALHMLAELHLAKHILPELFREDHENGDIAALHGTGAPSGAGESRDAGVPPACREGILPSPSAVPHGVSSSSDQAHGTHNAGEMPARHEGGTPASRFAAAVARVELLAATPDRDPRLMLAALLADLNHAAVETITRRWGASNEIRQTAGFIIKHKHEWREFAAPRGEGVPCDAGVPPALCVPSPKPRENETPSGTADGEGRMPSRHAGGTPASQDTPASRPLWQFKRLLANDDWPRLLAFWRVQEHLTTGNTACTNRIAAQASAIPPDQIAPPPFVTGDDLKTLGLPPGRRMGDILESLYRAQLDKQLTTRDQALDEAKRLMATP